MRNPHDSAGLLTILTLSIFIFMTCSSNDTSPVEPDSNPTVLTVTPSMGPPGTLLSISGYAVSPTDTATEIYVGGELSVLLPDSSGIQSMIPLFLDSARHWPAPPSGTLDVEIRKNGNLVALAKGAITIDSLQHADGATETIQQDFVTLANSLRTIWSLLPDIPGQDSTIPGYRQIISTMLDSILVGSDSSLASVLAGTSSWTNGQVPDVSLLDAILASSGALEYYNDAAGSLGRLTDSLTLARQQGLLCRGGGEDMDLACQMQIYVLLDDYANYFVKPTSEAYANTVGLVAGIVAISGYHFPPEVIISALMTVFDFVYGTLAPSLFPANITEFSLTVATDTIAVDENTNTAVLVAASNNPATIRATDVLEQLLSALGFAGAPAKVAEDFREVLVNAIKWALGMYRKGVEAYNKDTNNSIFIDPEGDLPPMSWGPVMVTHSDLVELYSFTEDIITSDTGVFEWKGVARGNGRIQARGRAAGEQAKVLYDHTLCLGCVYAGGAFGNNAPGTETKTVVVGKPAQLAVLIDGLPLTVTADVLVSGPNGYTSGTMFSDSVLKNLEPGDYHLVANEVWNDNGEPYIATPADTIIQLTDNQQAQITVSYRNKYGKLLLTVTGLPGGVAPDISITGPAGYQNHVLSDGIIDSLPAGQYSVVANDVINTSTGDTLTATPASQLADIVGGDTTEVTIDYGQGLKITVYYGPSDTLGRARAEHTDNPGIIFILEEDTQYAVDGYQSDGFTISNCVVEGITFNSVSGNAQAATSLGSASSSGSIQVNPDGFTIIASSSVTNTMPAKNGTSAFEASSVNTNINFGAGTAITALNKGVVVDIANPSRDTVDIVISWSSSASSTSGGTDYSGGSSHVFMAMSFPFDPCGSAYNRNDVVFAGCTDRVSSRCTGDTTITTTLAHIQTAFTTEVAAGSTLFQADHVPLSGSAQASMNLNVAVKKR